MMTIFNHTDAHTESDTDPNNNKNSAFSLGTIPNHDLNATDEHSSLLVAVGMTTSPNVTADDDIDIDIDDDIDTDTDTDTDTDRATIFTTKMEKKKKYTVNTTSVSYHYAFSRIFGVRKMFVIMMMMMMSIIIVGLLALLLLSTKKSLSSLPSSLSLSLSLSQDKADKHAGHNRTDDSYDYENKNVVDNGKGYPFLVFLFSLLFLWVVLLYEKLISRITTYLKS